MAVDIPHVEVEHLGPLQRLQARRQLADAVDRVAVAEERREEARLAAASAAREQRTAAIAAGERVVRAELPALITELRTAQQHMMQFADRMAQLNVPLAGRYFQEAIWTPLLAGELLDFWMDRVGDRDVQARAAVKARALVPARLSAAPLPRAGGSEAAWARFQSFRGLSSPDRRCGSAPPGVMSRRRRHSFQSAEVHVVSLHSNSQTTMVWGTTWTTWLRSHRASLTTRSIMAASVLATPHVHSRCQWLPRGTE